MKLASARLVSALVLLASLSCASATLGAYSLQNYKQTSYGFTGSLTLSTQPTPNFGPAISPLQLDVYLETADRVRIKISDPNNARWEVPQSLLPTPTVSTAASSQNYQIVTTSNPFGIAVIRNSDSVVMFNTTTNGIFNSLVFSDQYLEISTSLPVRANLYGLGEHIDPLRVDGSGSNGHTYTFWARDNGTPFDANLYGSHPFYIEMRNGRAHGVFLKNANGMDVVYYDGADTGTAYLTYKAIGGILDFYVFDGPLPADVTQQYQGLVGTPHMPPYWSLGWHQCRWGYNTIADVEHVVSSYAANNIPLDTMWTDIDYMQNYEDFSWDPTRYPQSQVASFVQSLHQNGQQYVVIVDPAIHNRTGYQPFMDGLSMDIFIKDSSGKPYIGEVWPGPTAFPDFLHPNGTVYWNNQVTRWLNGVPVDGMWIDMNEASNFLNVAAKPKSAKSRPNPVDTAFNPNNPPYAINNAPNHAPLNTHGLGPELTHYGGILEYNAHNLYGFAETIATRKTLESYYNKRSLVISRSTFPGSGTHGGHWLGDNDSDFISMRYSVPGILDMNIFGIPLVGADICGFGGNTTEELCSRWMELGAFYPFARNHNSIGSIPQEPYVWPSVAAISRKVLGARYSLLPYYYTLFYLSNTYGGTVARPLFFEFPTDAATLPIDEQFLIGSALMVSPVLGQGQTTVDVYFPPASQWYDFWSFTPVSVPGWQTLTSAIDQIQVHIRGGNIIPTQIPGLTTAASRQNAFQLIVALDGNSVATGALFLDDGSTLNFASDSHFISFTASPGSVSSQVIRSPEGFVPPKQDAVSVLRERARSAYLRNSGKPAYDYKTTFPSINQISVLGVTSTPSQVCVNSVCSAQFSYNQALQLLTIPSLSLSPVTAFQVTYQ